MTQQTHVRAHPLNTHSSWQRDSCPRTWRDRHAQTCEGTYNIQAIHVPCVIYYKWLAQAGAPHPSRHTCMHTHTDTHSTHACMHAHTRTHTHTHACPIQARKKNTAGQAEHPQTVTPALTWASPSLSDPSVLLLTAVSAPESARRGRGDGGDA